MIENPVTPDPVTPREAWRKAAADAAGTRAQGVYLVYLLVAALTVQGLRLARAVPDITALLVALSPFFIALLAAGGYGKWLEHKDATGPQG